MSRAWVAAIALLAGCGAEAPFKDDWQPGDTVAAVGRNVVAARVVCSCTSASMRFYNASGAEAFSQDAHTLTWAAPEKWVRIYVGPDDGKGACTVTFYGPNSPAVVKPEGVET